MTQNDPRRKDDATDNPEGLREGDPDVEVVYVEPGGIANKIRRGLRGVLVGGTAAVMLAGGHNPEPEPHEWVPGPDGRMQWVKRVKRSDEPVRAALPPVIRRAQDALADVRNLSPEELRRTLDGILADERVTADELFAYRRTIWRLVAAEQRARHRQLVRQGKNAEAAKMYENWRDMNERIAKEDQMELDLLRFRDTTAFYRQLRKEAPQEAVDAVARRAEREQAAERQGRVLDALAAERAAFVTMTFYAQEYLVENRGSKATFLSAAQKYYALVGEAVPRGLADKGTPACARWMQDAKERGERYVRRWHTAFDFPDQPQMAEVDWQMHLLAMEKSPKEKQKIVEKLLSLAAALERGPLTPQTEEALRVLRGLNAYSTKTDVQAARESMRGTPEGAELSMDLLDQEIALLEREWGKAMNDPKRNAEMRRIRDQIADRLSEFYAFMQEYNHEYVFAYAGIEDWRIGHAQAEPTGARTHNPEPGLLGDNRRIAEQYLNATLHATGRTKVLFKPDPKTARKEELYHAAAKGIRRAQGLMQRLLRMDEKIIQTEVGKAKPVSSILAQADIRKFENGENALLGIRALMSSGGSKAEDLLQDRSDLEPDVLVKMREKAMELGPVDLGRIAQMAGSPERRDRLQAWFWLRASKQSIREQAEEIRKVLQRVGDTETVMEKVKDENERFGPAAQKAARQLPGKIISNDLKKLYDLLMWILENWEKVLYWTLAGVVGAGVAGAALYQFGGKAVRAGMGVTYRAGKATIRETAKGGWWLLVGPKPVKTLRRRQAAEESGPEDTDPAKALMEYADFLASGGTPQDYLRRTAGQIEEDQRQLDRELGEINFALEQEPALSQLSTQDRQRLEARRDEIIRSQNALTQHQRDMEEQAGTEKQAEASQALAALLARQSQRLRAQFAGRTMTPDQSLQMETALEQLEDAASLPDAERTKKVVEVRGHIDALLRATEPKA